MSELWLDLVWRNHYKNILGISEEILIWTGLLDDIRELLVTFRSDNGIEVDRRMSLFFEESCWRILKLCLLYRIRETDITRKRIQKRGFNTGNCFKKVLEELKGRKRNKESTQRLTKTESHYHPLGWRDSGKRWCYQSPGTRAVHWELSGVPHLEPGLWRKGFFDINKQRHWQWHFPKHNKGSRNILFSLNI